jgi:hypothetical protein
VSAASALHGARLSARFLLLSLAALPGSAQRSELPSNHPSKDPYTGGEPAAMARAGVVSLGGFEFSTTDTAEVDAFLG